MLQPAQSLRFDLASAFARHRELLPDFLQRVVGVHADVQSRHGLNAGVPQVSSQRATFSCGTVGAPASIPAHWRSNSAMPSASASTDLSSSIIRYSAARARQLP